MAVKIVAWGGYDARKPRVRLLLAALRRRGVLAAEIGIPVWQGMDEKSLPTRGRLIGAALRLLFGLPSAIWRLLRSPAGAAILLPYPGTPEIFLIVPLAKLLRRKVVLDAFLPLHDTIVDDRKLVRPAGAAARLIALFEGTGLRLADVILVDTDQHGDFLANAYAIERSRFVTVLIGAEPLFDRDAPHDCVNDLVGVPDGRPIILFYGLLIPLHGIATILEAALRSGGRELHWVIAGKGQQEPLVRETMSRADARAITYIPWVDYARIPALIARADLCLGVFGSSNKAARVIPNKIFQALAMGKPIVTRSSPAVDALAARYPDTIRTVPENDPEALAAAVQAAFAGGRPLTPLPREALAQLTPDAGVGELIARLERA